MQNQIDKKVKRISITKFAIISFLFTTLTACGNGAAESPQAQTEPPQSSKTSAEATVTATAPQIALTGNDAQFDLGQKVFLKCKTCHTVNEGGRHRIGPNLYGIMDSQIASKDGFAYSKSFKASDITWTDENLDAFLAKPRDFIPKNRMTFVGLKKDEHRKAVIAYLHSVTK